MKKKRLVAAILCLALLLPLVTALPVQSAAAAADEASIQRGIGGIDAYDRVYFSTDVYWWLHEDVPWIVLPAGTLSQSTAAAGSLPLLSEYLLNDGTNTTIFTVSTFPDGTWHDYLNSELAKSQLHSVMEGRPSTSIYGKWFDDKEKAAVADTTLTAGSLNSEMTQDYSGQKLFPLSQSEARSISTGAYGYLLQAKDIINPNGDNHSWWLRTSANPTDTNDKAYYWNARFGDIREDKKDVAYYIRPAFHLDASKVLLTSAAVGGKSAAGMGSGLTAVGANPESHWKLTIADSARNGFAIRNTTWSGASVTFEYANAIAYTGTEPDKANEYLSAVIVDNDDGSGGGNVIYYGRILRLDSADKSEGTATINVPAGVGLSDDTRLYVFNEQFNGDRDNLVRSNEEWSRARTDYASPLRQVDAADFSYAAIGDVTVSGLTFSPLSGTDEATVTLENASFNALAVNADVSSWFTNLPTGLAAKIKTAVAQGDATAAVVFSGTPTVARSAAMTVHLPAGYLSGGLSLTAVPNPNAKWAITAGPTVATPTFSPPAGTYPSARNVTISCATAGATIRYTTDGNEPTESSAVYSTPISVTANTVIQAKAYKENLNDSATASAAYFITASVTPAETDPDTVITVVAGHRATMRVTVDSAMVNPGYQWKIDRNDGSGFVDISGATGASYTTSPTRLENDGYRYYCVVTNPAGSVSSGKFILRVTPYAPGEDVRAICLGTSGMNSPDDSSGSAVFSYVYFGATDSDANAIKWRVLDAAGGSVGASAVGSSGSLSDGTVVVANSAAMLLFSDGYHCGSSKFSDSDNNSYRSSLPLGQLSAHLSTDFKSREQSAMLQTTKSDGEMPSIDTFSAVAGILNGDKLFLLSAEELTNASYCLMEGSPWPWSHNSWFWTRSPEKGKTNYVGVRAPDATEGAFGERINYDVNYVARPGFNLKRDAVLFSSAAVGGKDGGGALAPVNANGDGEWRLTLRDPVGHRNFRVTSGAVSVPTAGGNVSVTYSSAKYGPREYLSAMIVDASNEVLYYGRLAAIVTLASASGTRTISIPALPAGSYTLKLFSEQYNGNQKTDYASAFSDVPLTVVADAFVPVTNILRNFADTLAVNTGLPLAGTVAPNNATNQTIVWSISPNDAGTTGATVTGGVFTATAAGTATVRATVINGATASTDYTQDFTITVSAAPVTTHTVAVSASPAAGGTVTGGGTYADGYALTVTATPNANYRFVKWTENGGQVSASASYAFTVTGSRTLVAVFEAAAPTTYTVTYDANSGSGTMADGTATQGVAFTLPACGFTAPAGRQFKEWAIGSASGTRVAAGSDHTFTADTTVYAVWEDQTPIVAPTVDPPETAPDRLITVVVGNTATLSVTATGTAPMGYQWYRSTDGGQSFSPLGAMSASYTTAPVTMANNGYQYYCTVTNEAGRALSAVFTLQVVERGADGGDGAGVPHTGDGSLPELWFLLLLLAGAGRMVVRRKRRV